MGGWGGGHRAAAAAVIGPEPTDDAAPSARLLAVFPPFPASVAVRAPWCCAGRAPAASRRFVSSRRALPTMALAPVPERQGAVRPSNNSALLVAKYKHEHRFTNLSERRSCYAPPPPPLPLSPLLLPPPPPPPPHSSPMSSAPTAPQKPSCRRKSACHGGVKQLRVGV
jgi:hypothetical protein